MGNLRELYEWACWVSSDEHILLHKMAELRDNGCKFNRVKTLVLPEETDTKGELK